MPKVTDCRQYSSTGHYMLNRTDSIYSDWGNTGQKINRGADPVLLLLQAAALMA